MRILYLHQYFITPDMPGGSRSYEMGRRLVQSGHEVHMITSDQSSLSRGWRDTIEAGIYVHSIGVPYANAMSYARRIQSFFQFAILSTLKAVRLGGDIVFATSTPLTIALPAIIASRMRRIPMVFEVRDLWPDMPIAMGVLKNPVLKVVARALEWTAYHASVHIIALSPGMAEGVMRRGISPGRITVIPNSCDVGLFDVSADHGRNIRERLGLSPLQPLVIYAGAFGRINGAGYLVDVADAMWRVAPEIRFLMVGSGAERDKIIHQAQELGTLGRNLWIWDPLPKQEMPDLFAAATVVTSLVISVKPAWNNSANKFFDALAAGKPIAINYGGWQADILNEDGAGIVLSENDTYVAAYRLAEFVRDKRRIKSASMAARKLARERFDRDTMAQRLNVVLVEAGRQE